MTLIRQDDVAGLAPKCAMLAGDICRCGPALPRDHNALGAPAFIEFIDAKFKFDADTHYSEPKVVEPKEKV